MKSSMKKMDKVITYSVERNEAWVTVTEGPWNWAYIMTSDKMGKIEDKDFTNVIKTGIKPDFVSRKHMSMLLNHFGVSKNVINKIFEKEKESVEIDV